MAENVEENLMDKYNTLLQGTGQFNNVDIRRVAKAIIKYENQLKLAAPGTQLLDNYNKVIDLEIGLLKEIKTRKAVKNTNITDSTNAETFFVNKVIAHFQKGSKYFSDNYDFQMKCFNFAKLFSDHRNFAVSMIKDLIATFGDTKSEVYRKAASLYYYLKDYDEARKILLSGQSKFPKEEDIYLDLLELELRGKQKTNLEDRLMQYIDFIADNKIGRRFLEETILVINIQFSLKNIAEYGLDKLLSTHEEVESYVFAAKWELRVDKEKATDENQPYSTEAVDKAIKRLKRGVLALPANQKPEMWKTYINFTKKLAATDLKLKPYMARALQEAEQSRVKMSVEHFLDLIDCHKNNTGIVTAKLEKGIQLYPDSDLVRIMYLKVLLKARRWSKLDAEFENALKALGNNTLRVWETYLTALTLACPGKVQDLLKKGVKDRNPVVSKAMKAKYCLWTGIHLGLDEARSLYSKLAVTPPYSNELHREMFYLERVKLDEPLAIDKEKMNKVLSLWQEQFGTVEKDIYLHRIEVLHQRNEPDCSQKILQVVKQALSKLKDPDALSAFKTQFDSLDDLREMRKLNKADELENLGSPTSDDFDSSPLSTDSVS